VEVFNTESAILDMYFLLISITMILGGTLALVRNLVMRSRFRYDIRAYGGHTAVDAMCRRRERM
jgi:hypothetical protein